MAEPRLPSKWEVIEYCRLSPMDAEVDGGFVMVDIPAGWDEDAFCDALARILNAHDGLVKALEAVKPYHAETDSAVGPMIRDALSVARIFAAAPDLYNALEDSNELLKACAKSELNSDGMVDAQIAANEESLAKTRGDAAKGRG